MTRLLTAKTFAHDVKRMPTVARGKLLDWLMEFMANPDDPRFEAHRVRRALMPGMWTAKVDDTYRVIYRQLEDGDRILLLCGSHDAAYRRAEKLRVVETGGAIRRAPAPPRRGTRL